MTITIINDCRDDNAAARQKARVQSLFGVQPTFVGVKNDMEAAGNLIDLLDAHGETEGVILVNVAPRHGAAKKWSNGTPFGYFFFKDTLVVSSIDGYVLSLVKKLKLAESIFVFDTAAAVEEMILSNLINVHLREHIINTQFRSYELTPRVAAYIKKNGKLSSATITSFDEITDAPISIWLVDNFGNCKTTLLADSDGFRKNEKSILKGKAIKTYNRLKDVPNMETGLITGSSGINNNRFLELVVQGKSAADEYGLSSGDLLVFE